jgi:hypothetical protein
MIGRGSTAGPWFSAMKSSTVEGTTIAHPDIIIPIELDNDLVAAGSAM